MEEQSTKSQLEQILKLTEENNKILHSMRRGARWENFFKFIYWAFILGGLAFSYYYIQPYLDTALRAYESIQNNVGQIQDTKDRLPDLNSLLDKLRTP